MGKVHTQPDDRKSGGKKQLAEINYKLGVTVNEEKLEEDKIAKFKGRTVHPFIRTGESFREPEECNDTKIIHYVKLKIH